jgi:4-amino-4-deoxy-L-arabinose transferase-like glycosyltransferase
LLTIHREIIQNNKNELVLFLIWSCLLYFISQTIRTYTIGDIPPFWDNITYQLDSLRVLKAWLQGDWRASFNQINDSMAPAHIFSLVFSFLVFGINSFSPYIVSGLFAFACISIIFLLSIELGASRRVAFWGVMIYSITPNFLYQNFLQTRNDFQSAFFIALSWLFVIMTIKRGNYKMALIAGIAAGLAALFKASSPGYIIFGVIIFLFVPEKYSNWTVKNRAKFLCYFIIGALIISGWHYLPHLNETLNYYILWGKDASEWKAVQYDLNFNLTNYLFYIKNINNVHFNSYTINILFGAIFLKITWNYFKYKKLIKYGDKYYKNLHLNLTIAATISPIIFLSINQSFSSLGDVPILPLFIAVILSIISVAFKELNIREYVLAPLLLFGLLIAFPLMPIVERQFVAKDFDMFSKEISDFREKYRLKNNNMMQVYSHPIYNVDAYSWKKMMNRVKFNDGNLTESRSSNRELWDVIFPEDINLIAKKLEKFQMLIISEHSGYTIGGESFHTFNRLHDEINLSLEMNGQFINLKKIMLEDAKFPVHLALNKNYFNFGPINITADHWVEWGEDISYFSLMPAKMIWRGTSIKKIKQFRLVGVDSSTPTISMKYTKDVNGIPEYQSDIVPGSVDVRTYKIMTDINEVPSPAAYNDSRKLAFYKIETNLNRK